MDYYNYTDTTTFRIEDSSIKFGTIDKRVVYNKGNYYLQILNTSSHTPVNMSYLSGMLNEVPYIPYFGTITLPRNYSKTDDIPPAKRIKADATIAFPNVIIHPLFYVSNGVTITGNIPSYMLLFTNPPGTNILEWTSFIKVLYNSDVNASDISRALNYIKRQSNEVYYKITTHLGSYSNVVKYDNGDAQECVRSSNIGIPRIFIPETLIGTLGTYKDLFAMATRHEIVNIHNDDLERIRATNSYSVDKWILEVPPQLTDEKILYNVSAFKVMKSKSSVIELRAVATNSGPLATVIKPNRKYGLIRAVSQGVAVATVISLLRSTPHNQPTFQITDKPTTLLSGVEDLFRGSSDLFFGIRDPPTRMALLGSLILQEASSSTTNEKTQALLISNYMSYGGGNLRSPVTWEELVNIAKQDLNLKTERNPITDYDYNDIGSNIVGKLISDLNDMMFTKDGVDQEVLLTDLHVTAPNLISASDAMTDESRLATRVKYAKEYESAKQSVTDAVAKANADAGLIQSASPALVSLVAEAIANPIYDAMTTVLRYGTLTAVNVKTQMAFTQADKSAVSVIYNGTRVQFEVTIDAPFRETTIPISIPRDPLVPILIFWRTVLSDYDLYKLTPLRTKKTLGGFARIHMLHYHPGVKLTTNEDITQALSHFSSTSYSADKTQLSSLIYPEVYNVVPIQHDTFVLLRIRRKEQYSFGLPNDKFTDDNADFVFNSPLKYAYPLVTIPTFEFSLSGRTDLLSKIYTRGKLKVVAPYRLDSFMRSLPLSMFTDIATQQSTFYPPEDTRWTLGFYDPTRGLNVIRFYFLYTMGVSLNEIQHLSRKDYPDSDLLNLFIEMLSNQFTIVRKYAIPST